MVSWDPFLIVPKEDIVAQLKRRNPAKVVTSLLSLCPPEDRKLTPLWYLFHMQHTGQVRLLPTQRLRLIPSALTRSTMAGTTCVPELIGPGRPGAQAAFAWGDIVAQGHGCLLPARQDVFCVAVFSALYAVWGTLRWAVLGKPAYPFQARKAPSALPIPPAQPLEMFA